MANSADPSRQESLEKWRKEYAELKNALNVYHDKLMDKYDRSGRDAAAWNDVEKVLERLYYFWSAAIVNAGDIFGYMEFMIENKSGLEATGAKGCLAAIDKLMPYYQEQLILETDSQKNDYWHRTKLEREPAEDLAEDVIEFARLLLEYAEKNAHRIGTD